ncbi:MAG: hypothetical protein HY909_25940, partial [Deltaproteobacteria bacterium]|nr:hypothetical protein [Deltaproteobacteria bacterium]
MLSHYRNLWRWLAPAALALAACGNGSDGTPPPPPGDAQADAGGGDAVTKDMTTTPDGDMPDTVTPPTDSGRMDVMMCPAGQTDCMPTAPAPTCVNTLTDPRNCGMCGMACLSGQLCMGGRCMSTRMTCPAGRTDCTPTAPAPTCVNTLTDPRNCGMCGMACLSGQTCGGGTCQAAMSCDAGERLCSGACVFTQSDARHCGDCGRACATGLTCLA